MKELCSIKQIIKGHSVIDGAGVRINRIIGSYQLDHIDPFVLLDEIKSDKPEDYIAGFPTHPHRGIETITYMVRGNFKHKDSRGNGGLITDGCVQWMTAGKGILHSEMPEKTKGLLWGYQLWLSLPAKEKMTEPGYQNLTKGDIPTVKKDGIEIKVISGSFDGVNGPARNWVRSNYFDVTLEKNAGFHFNIDRKMSSFCYVHTGSISVNSPSGSQKVNEKELAQFENGSIIEIKGLSEKSGFLFLSSYPNNEPIVRGGPFVMNTEEEIRQAFDDYQSGRLG